VYPAKNVNHSSRISDADPAALPSLGVACTGNLKKTRGKGWAVAAGCRNLRRDFGPLPSAAKSVTHSESRINYLKAASVTLMQQKSHPWAWHALARSEQYKGWAVVAGGRNLSVE
jgi:hypothetical protein